MRPGNWTELGGPKGTQQQVRMAKSYLLGGFNQSLGGARKKGSPFSHLRGAPDGTGKKNTEKGRKAMTTTRDNRVIRGDLNRSWEQRRATFGFRSGKSERGKGRKVQSGGKELDRGAGRNRLSERERKRSYQ